MDTKEQEIAIAYSKAKLVIYIVLFGALLAYIYSFFYTKATYYQSLGHFLFINIMLWGIILYSVIKLLEYIMMLFDSKPALVISDAGVFYRPNTAIEFLIPWEDINEIGTKKVKMAKYPVLKINYPLGLFSDIPFLLKLFYCPKALFRVRSLVIEVSLLNTSYQELTEVLNEELDNRKRRY